MSEKKHLKIAIIGAGPAGCTLARLLLNEPSIDVTVFEGETELTARSQGGTLDLHTSTGLKAIQEAGLFEEFSKHARYDGEAIAVVDKYKTSVFKLGGTNKSSSRGRPEIDRIKLRQVLVDSLPEGVLKWGKRLRSVDAETLDLHFDDGIQKGFDLLVGADGAWSKVRPVISPAQPYYTGIGGADMVIEKAEERYPHISKFVNRGSIFAHSDGKNMIIQQKGDDSLMLYAWTARDENWQQTSGCDVHDPIQLKENVSKEFADWDPLFREALQVTDDEEVIPRNLFMLPVGHVWKHRRGVTLIGDAAHLMTPFAGEGVNLAMEDSMKLAHTIIEGIRKGAKPETLDNDIRLFEEDMFKRATPVAELTRLNMEAMFFTPGAPKETIAPYIRRCTVFFLGNEWLLKWLMPLWLIKFTLRWVFWW